MDQPIKPSADLKPPPDFTLPSVEASGGPSKEEGVSVSKPEKVAEPSKRSLAEPKPDEPVVPPTPEEREPVNSVQGGESDQSKNPPISEDIFQNLENTVGSGS